MRESGDTRGANVMLGYKHTFNPDHFIDMNVSYNIWRGPNDNRFHENETWADGTEESIWQSQHQDVKISNWEAALDYSLQALPWLRFEAGYKGNYNHENSPASYAGGPAENGLLPLDELYNRFKYDTDISALYVNFSGSHEHLTFSPDFVEKCGRYGHVHWATARQMRTLHSSKKMISRYSHRLQ